MYFRSILSGTLALLLLTAAAAQADRRAVPFDISKSAENRFSLPAFELPGLRSKGDDHSELRRVAQAGDPRVTAMEEQLRSLSGTIEELNFQILQMQEQMRKMQEDNEFRFQELEEKRSDAGAPSDSNVAAVDSGSASGRTDIPVERGDVATEMETEVIVDNGTGEPAGEGLGTLPKEFGTIIFDEKGNVKGGTVSNDVTQSVQDQGQAGLSGSAPEMPAAAETQMAALPSSDDPEELYRNSYEFILSGDYVTAEAGFRDHISRFPLDGKAADSHFWLGEALLGQKKYRDAAEVFLTASKQYPSARKAPDMLLKLGISLVGLDQRDVACETFAEVAKRYPEASGALKQRIKQEQALAAC